MGPTLYIALAFAAGALICYLVMRERVRFYQSAAEQMPQTFRATSAEALEQSTRQFLRLAEEKFARLQEGAAANLKERHIAIDTLLKPMRESLASVDAQIRQVELDRKGSHSELRAQITGMSVAQERLRSETGKLSAALSNPTARGRWGEVQLHRVVELAGMLEYCDFTEQTRIPSAETALRPDMIIRLPNDRQIVVDSKVPMRAYLESCEQQDEACRAAKLKEHADQIRKHMKQLGSKAYTAQLPVSPEFVVAFLPGEVFFSAALQADAELLEFGVQNNVILATPTTLIALLKAVAYGWKQEQVARNAQEIQRLGAQLYERVRVFAEHYEKVGKSLEGAMGAYERGRQSMETRLLATARKFEDYGVAPTGVGALPEPLPFADSLNFDVDDESGSNTGRGGEATGTRRA